MYLNFKISKTLWQYLLKLTLTWDVFKWYRNRLSNSGFGKLTLTWDVFKFKLEM